MSIWTHVAGVIRVDGFGGGRTKEDFEPILGKEITFHSPYWMWDEVEAYPENFVPFGSEGGLAYTVWQNPEKDHLAANTISIFGDLRDYTKPEKIKEWFENILYNKGLCIRDAVISIDCGLYKEKMIVAYDPDRPRNRKNTEERKEN